MSIQIKNVTEPVVLGEGPHWDALHQALFFISIAEKTIHKNVPATEKHTRTKLDGRAGFIVPVEGTTDQFLIAVERKFLIVRWDGEDGTPATIVKEIAEVEQVTPVTRINDGKADPRGRVYAGTMDRIVSSQQPICTIQPQKGCLFRLDGGTVTKVVEGVRVSNGLAWDLKEKAMYYTDSMERNIRRYDYNEETGEVSNMRHVFDFEKNNITGFPDGCTIDTDGNLWVAVFTGSCVLNINPKTGELLRKILIPAPLVTSATFGGPNHDILFVTTANLNFPEPQKPPSGAVFMVTGLDVKGYPNINFKI